MSTLIETENTNDIPGIGLRSAVLVYSIISYAVGMGGLMWLILAMGGLVNYGFGPIVTDTVTTAILVNIGLVTLFGLQHTIMARRSFKEKLWRILPVPVERASFVLASGIVMAITVWCWQPVPGVVWSVEGSIGKLILWSLYLSGWAYLVVSTFVTNHFELFGLRQAFLYFRGVPHSPVRFVKKWMYSYSRHPMMLGIMVGMWSVPEMSASHLVLSLTMSLYIVIGVFFEERELVNQFGDTYREYRREIGTFFTISKTETAE